jgi:hypothetical protein
MRSQGKVETRVPKSLETSVADPNPFDTDPDPVFHFDTDPESAFQFDTDPDPCRLKKVRNLKRYLLFIHLDWIFLVNRYNRI